MKDIAYYNGKIGPIEEMTVPMNDRGCYFGDGVYDATCGRNGIPYALDEHVERFFNSAGLARIKLEVSREELKSLLLELAGKVETDGNIMVYWQATRGTAMRRHGFPDGKSNLWAYIVPHELGDMKKGIKLKTVEDTRFFHCNIKTLNLLPNVLAQQKAEESGADIALFHRGERVTECAHSNISIIKDKILKTAPADNLILPGIARAHLIKKCKSFDIAVDETAFTLKELMEADEIIITNSSTFCGRAVEVDGIKAGGREGEIIERLQKALMEDYLEETKAK